MLKGELIDAATDQNQGREAALDVIGWDNAVIEIENTCSKTANTIEMPLMTILMEGMKRKDERKAAAAAGRPAPRAAASPAAPPPTPPASGLIEPGEDFKDLSAPAKKIKKQAPPPGPRSSRKAAKPQTVPQKAQRKGFPVKMAVAAVAVLAVIGAAVLYLGVFSSGSVQDAYQQAIAEADAFPDPAAQIQRLSAFIAAHEKGEFTQKAEARINDIRMIAEEQDFDALMARIGKLALDDRYEKTATGLLQQYLSTYPAGRFAGEVKQEMSQIAERLDEADYQAVAASAGASLAEKITVYNRYIARHPDGKYIDAVKRQFADLSESAFRSLKQAAATCNQDTAWDPCIALCSEFIGAFKDHARLEEVVALKIDLQRKRDMAALKKTANQQGDDLQAALKVYLSFLEAHPDSALRQPIQAEIKRIEKKIAQQAQWTQLVAYADNDHNDIFERVKRLEGYIRDNPSGLFLPEAKDLMEKLQEKKKVVETQQRETAKQEQRQAKMQREEKMRQREIAQKRQLIKNLAARIENSGSRFRADPAGTVTDANSGLTWTLLDSRMDLGKCLNYSSAKHYVRGLTTGGYRDWRLPTASELAGIYKNSPFFPAGKAPWYWSSEAYVKGYHSVANIVTTKPETVFNIEQERQDRCGDVRAVRP